MEKVATDGDRRVTFLRMKINAADEGLRSTSDPVLVDGLTKRKEKFIAELLEVLSN